MKSSGFHYLLTCVDRFFRWPIAVPLPNIQAVTVMQAFLDHWIANFGVPATMTTDRGAQFALASNPGPHHHRICDRREEGLVKPPFCFTSLPTIVGKISHSNYLAKSAVFKFSSLFF